MLDLFCGGGGAAMGYSRAGFDVVGVDIMPQPRYPFEFVLADALSFPLEGFDAVHASPPCQLYSAAGNADTRLRLFEARSDYLAPTRALLSSSGLPWIIENVPGAPMRNDFELCGTMFGLGVDGFELRRHRIFEIGGWRRGVVRVPRCKHRRPAFPVFGHDPNADFYKRNRRRLDGRRITVGDKRAAMGVDWTNRDELSSAIPPAFTEFLGAAMLGQLELENRLADIDYGAGAGIELQLALWESADG